MTAQDATRRARLPRRVGRALTKSLPPTNARSAPPGRSPTNICAVRRLPRLVVACVAVAAVGSCGPFCLSGKVSLSNAGVDASYKCPNPANNLRYTVHGSLDLDNSTSKDLTIQTMSEEGVLVGVHGAWSIGSVGQKYDAAIDDFTPKKVRSGNKSTIRFTIPFNCTNSGPTQSTYGDFELKISLVSNAGTFTTGTIKHRLVIT